MAIMTPYNTGSSWGKTPAPTPSYKPPTYVGSQKKVKAVQKQQADSPYTMTNGPSPVPYGPPNPYTANTSNPMSKFIPNKNPLAQYYPQPNPMSQYAPQSNPLAQYGSPATSMWTQRLRDLMFDGTPLPLGDPAYLNPQASSLAGYYPNDVTLGGSRFVAPPTAPGSIGSTPKINFNQLPDPTQEAAQTPAQASYWGSSYNQGGGGGRDGYSSNPYQWMTGLFQLNANRS